MYLSRTRLGDHYKYSKEYQNAGIPIYAPFANIDKTVYMGDFEIKSFSLPHGDTTSYGFMIKHDEIGRLLFLTDCEYCPYSFTQQKVNHIMVEANYQLEYVDMDAPNFNHKILGHMSLDTCRDFVEHNKSPQLRTVTLIHSNPMTLDEKQAEQAIKRIVDSDVTVGIAKPGYEIELRKEIW